MFQKAAYTFIYYAVPLLLTIAVEAGIAYICGIKQRKEQRMLLLCNLLTNPLLNLALYAKQYFSGIPFPFYALLLFELLIVFAESFLLHFLCGAKNRRFLPVSFLCNAASFGVGLLFSACFF